MLLTNILNESNHTRCISLRNQKCMIKYTIINLHLDEYSQEFQYYPFAVDLDRCAGSCKTLDDLSNKVCVPNKSVGLNLSVFGMITGKNTLKISTKVNNVNVNVNMMVENAIKIKSRIIINIDVSAKIIKYVKNIISGILLHVVAKTENI